MDNVVDIGDSIIRTVTRTTAKWTKARKAAERSAAAMHRYLYAPSKKESLKSIGYEVMERAYLKASANNTLPAAARQIFYQARPLILARTDEKLESSYFTQKILAPYLRDYPEKTASWDVVFDARGHFFEPHTGVSVPLGTVAVRDYLRRSKNGAVSSFGVASRLPFDFPTIGSSNRYHTVLLLEKEGFAPLLERAQIAERFDLALMSTKGVSTTAARTLIERLKGARILVLRDFDQAGFTIASTLSRNTERYTFAQRPDVIDLGLRLTDVETEGLDAEPVYYKKPRAVRAGLYRNGATKEEAEFLISDVSGGIGERVELNAFTSAHFIDWLERKLTAHGVKKVVPDDAVLAEAFRRAKFVNGVNEKIKCAEKEAQEAAEAAKIPKGLRKKVEKILAETPTLSWDAALAQIASGDVKPKNVSRRKGEVHEEETRADGDTAPRAA